MTRWTRLALAGAAVVLAVALFVALRPDDDDEAEPTPAAQTTTGETTEETPTEDTETETEDTTTEEAPTTTEAEDPNAPQRIVIVVRNGQPVGGVKRPEIERDKRVLLVVRSDVEDEAHLHGYDLAAGVAPGQAARIRFQADTPGRFELELEERALVIAELIVR
ncbi:MAG: hypothetical protein ACRDOP_00865 [Gaiellaceae bacterium]